MKGKPTVAEIQRTLLAKLEEMGFSKSEVEDVAGLPGKAFEAAVRKRLSAREGEDVKAKPKCANYRARRPA